MRCVLVCIDYERKKLAVADEELRQLLPDVEGLFGPDDEQTLDLRTCHALTLEGLARPAEAEKEYRHVLAGLERTQGPAAPDTLDACHSLALCLQRQQKAQAALPYAQRALAGRLKTLGREHHDTRASQRLMDELMRQSA